VSSSKSYIVRKRQIWAQIWDTLPDDDHGGPLGANIWCILVRLLYSEMLYFVCLALVTIFITILGAAQRDRFNDLEVRPYRQNGILATSFWNVDRSLDVCIPTCNNLLLYRQLAVQLLSCCHSYRIVILYMLASFAVL
jgi:hypothetical protein